MTLRRIENDPATNANVTLSLGLIALVFFAASYFVTKAQLRPITHALEVTPVVLYDKSTTAARKAGKTITTTWGKKLKAEGIPLYVQCRMTAACNKGLRVRPVPGAGIALGFTGFLFLASAFLVNLSLTRKRDQLDDAKWLRVDEFKHPEVVNYLLPGQGIQTPETEEVIVPLGYVIEQMPMPNNMAPERPIRYRYTGLKRIGLTSKMLQEHVLVYGPTGTGKTSRVLMHFLIAFAKRQDATVVLDFKYPEVKESFMVALPLFKRLGNPVWPILPYTRGGYHVPLFDYIQTHQDGRDLAAILIPKPEYGDQDSNFYKDTQQIILGAVLKIVASSTTPNFTETIRVCNQTVSAFTNWLEGNGDLQAKEALLRFLEDGKRDWNGFITGIINALEPFADDRISRTFTSAPGHNFDPEEFVTQGGLVYFGVDSDMMRTPRGEVVVRVFDNWLTNQLVRLRKDKARTGPQKSIRLVYDEAPSIGRLRYVLKSVATLRSFDFSFIFGIQNEEQMSLVYGEDVWEAIDQNLATQIILPTGFKKSGAAELSRNLGEREIRVKTTTQSAGMGGLTASQQRKGHSFVTQKRALVTPSEIGEWPYFLAILLTKGTLPPALLALVPFYDPKPEYIGLDNRRFTLDNSQTYNDWVDIMDDYGSEETERRGEEIWDIIEESLTEADRRELPSVTLKDVFNEWIRFAIRDGSVFRRSGKSYDLKYDSLHRSLRDSGAMKAIRAFMTNGWIHPGDGIQESPQDWDWIKITPEGLKELGSFAQLELSNIRFSSVYIQERRRLSEAAPEIGARYEEAREILPEEAARNATIQMLLQQDATLTPQLVNKAADLILSRFTVEQEKPIKLLAIPLSMPFERIVPRVLAQVHGEADSHQLEEEASWDERAGLTDPPPVQSEAVQATATQLPATPAPPAPAELSKEPTLEAVPVPPVQASVPITTPAPPVAPGSQGGGTPDIEVDEDDEDELSLSAGMGVPAGSPQEVPTEDMPFPVKAGEKGTVQDGAPVPGSPDKAADPPPPKKGRGNLSNLRQFKKPEADREAFDGDL